MLRRRSHPAHRIRRAVGASCVAAYIALAVAVGAHERRTADATTEAGPDPDLTAPVTPTTQTLTVEPAAFAPPSSLTAPPSPTSTLEVPRPATAPRKSGFVPTTRPPVTTAAPTTSPAAPTTSTTPASSTLPPTTTLPATTVAPSTTIFLGGS